MSHSSWWAKLGREPKCFGNFVQGQAKCDGHPPCSHLVPCRAWVGICSHLDPRKTSQDEFRSTLTEDGFRRVLYNACRSSAAPTSTTLRLTKQWEEFFDAFRGAIPARFRDVAPGKGVGRLGGLFLTALEQKGKLPAGWQIYEDTVDLSPPLCVYIPRPIARPTPRIAVRVSLERLRKLAPWIGNWAMSWEEKKGLSVASEVQKERVAAMGRMVGLFWTAGILDGQHNEHETRWETPLVRGM